MTLLEARQLTKIFSDGTAALRDVDLTIAQGEFIVLAGTNGSGKTVLAKHCNGLIKPTSGRILWQGRPVEEQLQTVRRQVGFVFQDSDNQIVGQTVAADVAFGPENLCLPAAEVEQRVRAALEAVEMAQLRDQQPYRLSGGLKRKLAIAGILAMEPQLIILDEPFTGLDYPGVVQVLKAIISLHRRGHAIMIITHELEKVLAHATRLVIMVRGTIVRDGPPQVVAPLARDYGLRAGSNPDPKVETLTWLT